MEPARKQPQDIEPDIRPRLGVIEGGGETTNDRPGRDTMRVLTSEDLQAAENSIPNPVDQSIDPEAEDVEKARLGENAPRGPWTNNFTPTANNKDNKSGKEKTRLQKLKPLLPLIGAGGGLGIIALLFLALLPLKLNMFIGNITQIASEVPGYAVERRTEYIAARLLAVHLIKKANGISGVEADSASKAVFCKTASISCSLLATYGSNYFDNLIDVSIGERFGDNVRITIKPKGVTQLGGSARSWTVEIARDLGDGQVLRTTKALQSNAEAKAYLKNLVNKNLKTKSIATRFLARAILMKKYGITHWRAFEKTSNKIEETKTKIHTSILKNTAGKVSGRMALYLGCFQNSAVCDSLKEGFASQANDLQSKIDDPNTSEKDKERFKAQKEALDKLSGKTPIPDEELAAGGGVKQIIIKRLLAVAGVAGVIGTVDMIFGAVEAVNNGALEQVSADMAKVTYIGFAFGDETGLVPNMERIMAGDGDLETYGELTSLLDGAEQSPLMQYENGIMTASDAASKSYSRTCNVNDEQTTVTLPAGQLVCPERSIGRDYTSLLATNPSWQALASTATIWNNSVGTVIDAVTGFIGTIPVIQWISETVSNLAKPVMEWAISLFFVPPPVGYETTGQNNYDALSGAIRVTNNSLMEEGVSNGSAFGAGGSVLSKTEISAISNEVNADKQADFNNQPLVARVFNPSLSGSFAQRLLAQIPTSIGGLFSLPKNSLNQLASITGSSTSAYATTTINPFNMPIYGYSVNDPALETDPSNYTEEFCSASAKAREESYGRDITRSTLPTYAVSDPCALEKMVVGSMLQAQGVTDDKYSLKEPGATDSQTTSSNTGRPANAIDLGKGWGLNSGADYSSVQCDSRTDDQGVHTTVYGAIIRTCQIKTTFSTKDSKNGSFAVSSLISTNAVNMFEAANADGIKIGLADGMRYGFDGGYTSQHPSGIAMDIQVEGKGTFCFNDEDTQNGWGTKENAFNVCKNRGGDEFAAFEWLNKNAEKYGLYNYDPEPWHWSTSGK